MYDFYENMNCCSNEVHIEPKRIAFLKFILEGYDGLATITTLDRKKGLVRIIYPESRARELGLLLQDLIPSLKSSK